LSYHAQIDFLRLAQRFDFVAQADGSAGEQTAQVSVA